MDYKLEYIYQMFKDAKCELEYKTIFQLLIAVSLSAQTTDKRVNECTYNGVKSEYTHHEQSR